MNRIAELRVKMGLSMKEAASRLEMPYTTYVNYEKGTREPNSETLIKLSRFFPSSRWRVRDSYPAPKTP